MTSPAPITDENDPLDAAIESRARAMHRARWPGRAWSGSDTNRTYWRRKARTAIEGPSVDMSEANAPSPVHQEAGEGGGRVQRRIQAGLSLRDTLKAEGAHFEAQTVSDLVASLRASSALNSVLHRDLQKALAALSPQEPQP
jgi:hypothetical protein